MRKRAFGFAGLCIAAVIALFTVQLGAQEKTKPAKMLTFQGSVASVDKAKMEIGVKISGVKKAVIYNADTKFLYGHSDKNTPGNADAIKEGFYISCTGTTEAGKPQLMGKTCVYRETR